MMTLMLTHLQRIFYMFAEILKFYLLVHKFENLYLLVNFLAINKYCSLNRLWSDSGNVFFSLVHYSKTIYKLLELKN